MLEVIHFKYRESNNRILFLCSQFQVFLWQYSSPKLCLGTSVFNDYYFPSHAISAFLGAWSVHVIVLLFEFVSRTDAKFCKCSPLSLFSHIALEIEYRASCMYFQASRFKVIRVFLGLSRHRRMIFVMQSAPWNHPKAMPKQKSMVAEPSDLAINEPSLYEGSNEATPKWSNFIEFLSALLPSCCFWMRGGGGPFWAFLSPAGVWAPVDWSP